MTLRRRQWLAAFGAALAGGCATPGPDIGSPARQMTDEPDQVPAPAGTARPVALVLSGGAARGFAHLGMLRVLEREGLRPDLVVGTSAGAIVGALYASGLTVAQIERAADRLDWSVLLDFDPLQAALGGIGLGLLPGQRLERFLDEHIALPIQRFPIAFAAVAADMESGDVVVLNHGNAARAVRASAAVPGVFAPVRSRGRLLADGQVVSPLPVAAARRLGAQRVLAFDVVYPPHQAEMSNPLSMLFQSIIVSGWRHVLAERALADVVVAPEIRSSAQLGLGSRDWVTRSGEAAALAQLAAMRKLFAPPGPAVLSQA